MPGAANRTGEFVKFAGDNYSQIVYGNVAALARFFFPPGATVQDLGCGPGLCSALLVKEKIVDPEKLTLLDEDPVFLEHAQKLIPQARAVEGSVFTDAEQSDCALFVNISGYFTSEELLKLFRRRPAKRVIANFFFTEDQTFRHPRMVNRRGDVFRFRLWKDEGVMTLRGLKAKDMPALYKRAGYKLAGEFRYFDFKFERFHLLEAVDAGNAS